MAKTKKNLQWQSRLSSAWLIVIHVRLSDEGCPLDVSKFLIISLRFAQIRIWKDMTVKLDKFARQITSTKKMGLLMHARGYDVSSAPAAYY